MTRINNDYSAGCFRSFFANKFDDGSTKLKGQPNFKHQPKKQQTHQAKNQKVKAT